MGGITRRGIYDNMKTALDKVKKGKGRTVNKRFAAMCTHYLVDADQGPKGLFVAQATSPRAGRRASSRRMCRTVAGARATQGPLRGPGIDAAKLRFGSFVELNAWLGDRCRALWDEVRYTEHEQVFAIDTPASRMNKGYAEDTASTNATLTLVLSTRRTND